jgi:hypothetical integral membrane protein (TIGR02206 family)
VVAEKSILFGVDHIAALALSILAAYWVVRAARSGPFGAERARRVLAVLLPLMIIAWPIEEIWRGQKAIWAIFPLDLCTFNLVVSVIAIYTMRQRLFECMYFWSIGAFLALVTPPLTHAFPHPRFLAFFALHALLICSWAFLVAGVKMQLTRRAWLRVWIYTNVLAFFVGIVDVTFDKNYFFLRGFPDGGPTLLNAFGPWPVYIITADLTMLGLFYLMQAVHTRVTELQPELGGDEEGELVSG